MHYAKNNTKWPHSITNGTNDARAFDMPAFHVFHNVGLVFGFIAALSTSPHRSTGLKYFGHFRDDQNVQICTEKKRLNSLLVQHFRMGILAMFACHVISQGLPVGAK